MKALIAVAEAKGWHEDQADRPRMPVAINDLLELGMQRGPDLNRVMELLNRRWEESGCRLGREQLINSLYTEDY